MATYITLQDLIATFGQAEVDAWASITSQDISALIGAACSEADTYLAAAYRLPLPAAPVALVGPLCDIVRYKVYAGTNKVSENIVTRATEARAFLKDLSAGRAKLVLPVVDDPSTQANEAESAAVVILPAGEFSRSKTMGW